jgi:hypothetical protein
VLSGIPSTAHALLTGGDPLAAAVAAGNLLLPARPERRWPLLAAGGVAHAVLSAGWGVAVAFAVRRSARSPVAVGAAAGAAHAAQDHGLVVHRPAGRRRPRIRALPVWPQVADHVAFGAIAGAALRRRV